MEVAPGNDDSFLFERADVHGVSIIVIPVYDDVQHGLENYGVEEEHEV